jgi:hypothetical protein
VTMIEQSLTENGSAAQSVRTPPRQRDLVIAWVTDAVACGYVGWQFWVLWRGGRVFKDLFEGLGAQLPPSTQLVIDHGVWLMPCLYGTFTAAVFGKELVVHDKRFSAMLTCLLVIVAQWVAHAVLTAYYLPLMDLIGKLS